MSTRKEDWDKDIPDQRKDFLDLIAGGDYTVTIKDLAYLPNKYHRQVLGIKTDKGNFSTGAWNVINFLRDNKPVIGKTFSFHINGAGTYRRFTDLEVK